MPPSSKATLPGFLSAKTFSSEASPSAGEVVVLERGEEVVADPGGQTWLELDRAIAVDHQGVAFLAEERQGETRGEFLGGVADHETFDIVAVDRVARAGVSEDPEIAVIGGFFVAEGGFVIKNQTRQKVAVREQKSLAGGLIDPALVVGEEKNDARGSVDEEFLALGEARHIALGEGALID